MTTTACDAIVQLLDMEEPLEVQVQQKTAILGADQMTSVEKMKAPTDKVVLFH